LLRRNEVKIRKAKTGIDKSISSAEMRVVWEVRGVVTVLKQLVLTSVRPS
jgi:hypothetical protein